MNPTHRSHRHRLFYLGAIIHLHLLLPLFAQLDLSGNRPPLFNPTQVSAGAFGNAFVWSCTVTSPAPFSTRIVAEFFLSKNQVAGDGDDVKLFEIREPVQSFGPVYMENNVNQHTAFLTNLFIPTNLTGSYFLYQRLSFEAPGTVDPTPGNNILFNLEPIAVRPYAGGGVDYAPAALANQQIMFVTTAATLGTGNTLTTIQNGTFAMPYRSATFPAENGTVTYLKTAASSARLTATTTNGGLSGLQRILSLAFDSPNTGTYTFTANHLGSPRDSGSGFFYQVTPITNHVSLGTAYVEPYNPAALPVTNAVTLRWTGGAPPFTIETISAIAQGTQWQVALLPFSGGTLTPATNLVIPSLSVLPANPHQFYRIRKP